MDLQAIAPVSLALLISSLALFTCSSPAFAGPADTNSRTTVAPQVLDPDSVDETTLRQSARAFVKVSTIIRSGKQAFDNASDDSQKQQIKEQVAQKKLAAVKAEGLQPQKFNQVLELVQVDKPLRQKFLTYVKDAKSSSAGASPGSAEP